ncbi:MAG: RNA polymerase sigma factor [Pirellulaceae bacterium]|nr:RNA polymerase sigma factor [Pirellulaceae bacterium]
MAQFLNASELACDPAEEFASHQGWLRTVLLSRLGNREEADEVLQEIALAAANQSAKRQPVDRVGPWLYRVALRQVLLLKRKQGRRRRLLAGVVAKTEVTDQCQKTSSPLDWMLSEERGQRVREALLRMDERDRQLLLLKYVEGFSYEEISLVLGVTVSSVQSRLHRARKILRDRLIIAQVVP